MKTITDDLAVNGIEVATTDFNTDSKTFINDRWYIVASLTLHVYTEWMDDLGAGTTLKKIPIDLHIKPLKP